MAAEANLTRRVRSYLDALIGCWYFKVWQGPLSGTVGIPDIIGCYRGRFFALELKAPDGKVSPMQERIIRLIRAAGGRAEVCRTIDDACRVIEDIGLEIAAFDTRRG